MVGMLGPRPATVGRGEEGEGGGDENKGGQIMGKREEYGSGELRKTKDVEKKALCIRKCTKTKII